jgi:hypothetical protein
MQSCEPPAALNVLLWPVAPPKNRVGGSAAFSFVFAFQYIGQTLDTPAENGGCGYDFASGVHKYLYAEDNPVNLDDPSGKDAMIIQQWGWSGHTCFVITDPKGGVMAFHYFAKGHKQGSNWFQSSQGLIYDKEDIWQDGPYPSFGAFLDKLASETSGSPLSPLYNDGLGYSVEVLAYAYGTSSDDQRVFDELSHEVDQSLYGYYSFGLGNECVRASWDWFHGYAGDDAPMPAYLSTAHVVDLSAYGASRLKLPHEIYITPLARMPSIESVQDDAVDDSLDF